MHKHIIFTNMRTEQDNNIFKKLIANLPLNFHTFLTKMHPPYLPDVSPVHIIRESAGEEGLFRRICCSLPDSLFLHPTDTCAS